MISQEKIQETIRRLVGVYDPIAIYLFGSYAWGNPDDESDLDILVIIENSNEKPHQRKIKAADALWDLGIPKDLLIFTKNEFVSLADDETTLCHKIKDKGTVVYARA